MLAPQQAWKESETAMLKLVISDDEGKTTSVPLVREEITIGRKEGNTIRLTDRNVSRRHARLQKQNGHYLLHDLGSYNGIVLNGTRVHDVTSIKHGDQILIGDYKLAIQEEGAAPVATPQAAAPVDRGGFADTIEGPVANLPAPTPTAPGIPSAMAGAAPVPPARASMPSPQPGAPRASLPPPAPAAGLPGLSGSDVPGHIRQMRLVFLAPAGAPAPVSLERLPLILGRSEVADVALPFSSISREHARLSYQDGQLIIEDMGSSNGITVNGNKVPRSKVSPGDLVALGVVEFRLATGGDSTAVLQRDAFEEVLERGANKKASSGPSKGVLIGIVVAVLAIGGGLAVAMRGSSNPSAGQPNSTVATAPNPVNAAPASAGSTPTPAPTPTPPPAPAANTNAANPPTPPTPEAPAPAANDNPPPSNGSDNNMVIAPGEDSNNSAAQRQRDREREQQRERERARQNQQDNPGSSGSSSSRSGSTQAAQPAQPAAPAVAAMDQARACHGDNNCVVRALEGHARTEAEVGMLAVTYRLMGRGGDATRMMNQYIHRFPDGPRSAEFRRRLGIDQ